MNFGISFSPLIPAEYVWAAAAIAAAIAALLLVARSRGALIRTGALTLLVLALANPSLTREDRDPLSSVAVVVVDKSPSQNFGERAAQTEAARAAIQDRIGDKEFRTKLLAQDPAARMEWDRLHKAGYPAPPAIASSAKASRTSVASTLSVDARPPQTPAIRRSCSLRSKAGAGIDVTARAPRRSDRPRLSRSGAAGRCRSVAMR